MQILWKFSANDPIEDICFTACGLLCCFTILDIILHKSIFLCKDFSIYLQVQKSRNCLARSIVDVAVMTTFSVLGFVILESFDGWQGFAADGSLSTMYQFNSYAQMICIIQAVYEFKSIVDSVRFNDGFLFIAHHLTAGLLASLALYPYCHKYSSFFLGISEISTAALCVLVNFDDERGIKGLKDAFPTLTMVFAGIFAVLFIVCRIILWPIVSYFFWKDSLRLLTEGNPHSKGVVLVFLVCNAGLTLLQFVWLGELITTAKDMLSGKLTERKKTK
jgi:hypothetical protein